MISQFICVMETVQLQQSSKDLRRLKYSNTKIFVRTNIKTTPKPHHFGLVLTQFCLFGSYHGLLWMFLASFHNVTNFEMENIPYSKVTYSFQNNPFLNIVKIEVLHHTYKRLKKDEKLDCFPGFPFFFFFDYPYLQKGLYKTSWFWQKVHTLTIFKRKWSVLIKNIFT